MRKGWVQYVVIPINTCWLLSLSPVFRMTLGPYPDTITLPHCLFLKDKQFCSPSHWCPDVKHSPPYPQVRESCLVDRTLRVFPLISSVPLFSGAWLRAWGWRVFWALWEHGFPLRVLWWHGYGFCWRRGWGRSQWHCYRPFSTAPLCCPHRPL